MKWESEYQRKISQLTSKYAKYLVFLGSLKEEQMGAFYANLNLLVLPSVNSTEAFGMVQVESMACGTPVVTSDLPGMRQPIKLSGMGEIVPPADEIALAKAILHILDNPQAYQPGQKAAALIAETSPQQTAIEYEKIFDLLL